MEPRSKHRLNVKPRLLSPLRFMRLVRAHLVACAMALALGQVGVIASPPLCMLGMPEPGAAADHEMCNHGPLCPMHRGMTKSSSHQSAKTFELCVRGKDAAVLISPVFSAPAMIVSPHTLNPLVVENTLPVAPSPQRLDFRRPPVVPPPRG